MPKIIEGLEDKILESAIELFAKKGYRDTNLREIAKASGIATGTFYNYFSNKNEIFDKVLKKIWEEKSYKISEICNNEISGKDKMVVVVDAFFDELVKIKGLIKEIFIGYIDSSYDNKIMIEVKEEVIVFIVSIIRQIRDEGTYKLSKDLDHYVANLIFNSIIYNLLEFRESREKNTKLLRELMECVLGER